ncbi:TcdA/TcdB pore-forming domain-containing protein [Xenorhabdus miraniensis]|uniref:Toxin B n=1 Tax=Xenorhabdus miraniensis TaxID=351674 RepID=A0A2D0JR91_9GAMM|nr:TcdA/TcdB pore-forming domain-containing protein [Xenorhabdus miraniensis]PHM48847.1 toxin B [Xenorhabdus miraniensis]
MTSMSKDFTHLLNTLIDRQIMASGRQTEWFNMSPDERSDYIRQVDERLQEMQQSTLSVLAAQYFQMQDTPVSVDDQLQMLQQRRQQMNNKSNTPAINAYKQQLDRDIRLYQRQQAAMQHFESTWDKALTMLSPGKPLNAQTLSEGVADKQAKLDTNIQRLEQQLATQVADSTFTPKYVTLFSELQAYKDVNARYNTWLNVPAAQKAAALSALTTVPRASDDLPVNISLLMMEERPGYIRMNVALVNASTDGRFKDFFLENGRLVVPTNGVLNFSFGTAARSLAWQQQYRLKSEPPSFRSPTYAPIRSVLVKTEFVEKCFASYLVSESTLREGFKAQLLSDGHKMLLTNVDRKVPNQIGVQVSGQSLNTTITREVPLPGALSDLINQNADISSFQTIGLEGFRQNSYHPDRDGLFVNIHELERSVGFAGRQYLLEMPQGKTPSKTYLSATPFVVMSVDGDKMSSSHLSKAQTAELYQYNAAFFEKLDQLRDDGAKASRLFKGSSERTAFEQQLVRLLERNHITPAGVLESEYTYDRMRDIKGNNLNKVLWEQAFAASVWQSVDNDPLLFELAASLVKNPAVDKILQGGYVQNDIAQAKKLLVPLYEQWRIQAIEAETQRVASANAAQHPSNPKKQVFDQVAVERSLDGKLLTLLLAGPKGLESDDVQLRLTVKKALLSHEGRSLRKQALFHVLRPVADGLSKTAVPVNPHAELGAGKVMINNRLNQPDPYLILNTSPEELAYHDGSYLIKDDKYRSYNQFRSDVKHDATRYMNDLDTPFMGGISGTTQTVSNVLPELFGGTLSVKQYWQFQMANAAFMIRNGYHSFFETFYVAARYEPEGADSIGKDILRMFDKYRAEGSKRALQGELYDGVMARVLPIVNQGLSAADEFHPPRFTQIGPMPALLGQAVKDLQLKTGLPSLGAGFEFREGSANIQQFANNPKLFAKSNTISAEALVGAGQLPAEGRAQLVKIKAGLYEVEYSAQSTNDVVEKETNSVPAYFLGYNGANQDNTLPAYIDIPKHAAPGSFLFTGSLSGSSVVVTNLDENTYRVYHDGRVNSSLLYDNVVMAVDYKDYQVAGTVEGFATTYMQYINDEWQLVSQRQEYQRDGQMLWPRLRNGEEPILIQIADNQRAKHNQIQFATYRESIHQKLKKIATQFGITSEGVSDKAYEAGEFSPHHPAIAAWIELCDEIQAKITTDTQKLVDKRDELYKTWSSTRDEQIKQLNITLEFYKEQYDSVLREVLSVEQSWLWQQIKSKNGIDAVLQINDTSIQGGGRERKNSLGERYAIAEAYQQRWPSPGFIDGLSNFQDISIPGFNDKMSVLEMKSLFLDSQLTPKQRGALSGRIAETSQAEYIDKVLKQTAVFSENFQRAGSSFSQLAPQDFYLSLVGDVSGGRCYPLVRAMAVAVANSGKAGINRLVEKLFLAAASPQEGSSILLKNSLAKLHSNVEAVQALTARGKFTLQNVVSLLKEKTGTSMFALNTRNHAMMVGVTIGDEGRRYYFYDPNVGIFAFNNSDNFFQAINKHLVKRKMAVYYGSLGSESNPEFNLMEIDPDKMARVSLGNGLDVADLSSTDELATVIEQRQWVKQTVIAQEKITKDAQLRTALVTLDAEQWGAKFDESITRLAQENKLDQHWMPIIGNTEETKEGHYRVQFINRDRPEEIRWVNSNDATFVEFRRFVDEHMSTLGQHFTLKNGQIQPKGGVSEGAPIDGLNAGFAVQTLIQWFADKNRHDAAHGIASPDLATALKIHSYLNYAQMVHSGLNDVAKVTELVTTALRGGVVGAKTSLNEFSSALAHTANEGVGLLLGGAFVGLDAYELAHAETDTQKAVYGTQLAFDSASFVTGAAGVGAGLVGASTTAAVLGGAGVILGGLAVGFTALAQAFGAVAEDAKAVGCYFDMLDKAYKDHGYRYDNEKGVLIPLPGAVIKTLDLRNGQIGFDSQYIYRTHSGSTGSGEINYFFWVGDFPKMVHDRKQAIEVRSGIGYKETAHKLDHSDSNVLILPGTPKSYIRYEYMILPGATTRHDTGFDVIRRLEKDKRFDYDFYIFPSEQTIRRIHQEYVKTSIEVILDQNDRKLIVPKLPKELHGYLNYEIKGAGGRYLIGLNKGTKVKLTSDDSKTDGSGNMPSRWIIDSSQLTDKDKDIIKVSKNQLEVGGVVVELDSSQNGQILVVNGDNEVREVDFSKLTTTVVSEDASKWKVSGQQIEQHLNDLADAHQLHGQYVVVENYKYNERDVGRAFYDVTKKRMLFTDTTIEQAKHAQLGAVVGDYAYFYDADNAVAWRVDIATGQVNAQFEPWFNDNEGKISHLWQEGNDVYLARRYRLKEKEAELSYRIIGDRMELVSAVGDDDLLQLSARTAQHSRDLKYVFRGYESNRTPRETLKYTLGTRIIQPTREGAELVTVFGKDAAGVAHRYWIRTSDGTLIKPNLAPPKEQTLDFTGVEQNRSAWQIPADLVLAGSISRPSDTEVFFFYSRKEKALFRQEGSGQVMLNANRPTALRVSTPPLANVVNLEGNLIAVTEDGRVAQLNDQGRLSYEAVNEHWLKGRTHWWKALSNVTDGSATLAVFGVKGSDGKSLLPVWYHTGQVVVASAELQGKSLQFLGFEANGTSARLFEPESGQLYLQPVMTDDALAAAFGTDQVLNISAQLPTARELMSGVHFKAVQQVDVGIRLTTDKGEILLRTNNGELRLVGVDESWKQSNMPHLSQALTKLANQWQQDKGVLTLQDSNMRSWFDIDSGQIFSGNGIPASNNLRFIGTNVKNQTAYVYNQTSQKLYEINGSRVKGLNSFTGMERINSSLILQGGKKSDDNLTLPLIDGVDSLVLHGGAGGDTYRLNKEMWNHYRAVIIDNDDPNQTLDRLCLPIANPESILVNRYDDDLMLTDTSNGTALIVRQVFGSKAEEHQHLHINLEGASSFINVEHLVKSISKQDNINGALMDLSWASGQSAITANAVTTDSEAQNRSLANLIGAMASFPDVGSSHENLLQGFKPAKAEQQFFSPDFNSVII